ncbi:hypothetical protein IMZ48_02940 [Candidatus Bathyarchaeota archaeon]|nr:hypothetical protein [Candidatus Bathyarchaeota archaeon]
MQVQDIRNRGRQKTTIDYGDYFSFLLHVHPGHDIVPVPVDDAPEFIVSVKYRTPVSRFPIFSGIMSVQLTMQQAAGFYIDTAMTRMIREDSDFAPAFNPQPPNFRLYDGGDRDPDNMFWYARRIDMTDEWKRDSADLAIIITRPSEPQASSPRGTTFRTPAGKEEPTNPCSSRRGRGPRSVHTPATAPSTSH